MLESIKKLSVSSTARWATVKLFLVSIFITNPEMIVSAVESFSSADKAESVAKMLEIGAVVLAYLGINKGRLDADSKPSLKERSEVNYDSRTK